MRQRTGAIALMAAGFLLVPSLLAFDQGCETPSGPAAIAPKPIVIGVSLGLTNALASTSAPLKQAVRVAESQINSLGGLFGQPVEFKVIDDTSDEDRIVLGVVTSLVDVDHAVAILGPVGSSQVVATQDFLLKNKIIQISPSATSTDLTTAQPRGDRYFFRTTPPDDLQGKAVVLFAVQGPAGVSGDAGAKNACSKMAIVHIDNSYGNAMADVISKFFPTKGGTVVANITVAADVADNYKAPIAQMIASGPDCEAIIAYDPVGDAYMSDLKNALALPNTLPATFFTIGTDGVYTPDFVINGRQNKADPSSPNVVDGVYGTNPDTNPLTREYTDFRTIFTSYFPLPSNKTDLESYTSSMYDAAILAILAIQQAGGTVDRQRIRDALYDVSRIGRVFGPAQLGDALQAIQNGVDIDYKGASGNVDLDDQGNVVSDYIVWKVDKGNYVTIGRIKSADLL